MRRGGPRDDRPGALARPRYARLSTSDRSAPVSLFAQRPSRDLSDLTRVYHKRVCAFRQCVGVRACVWRVCRVANAFYKEHRLVAGLHIRVRLIARLNFVAAERRAEEGMVVGQGRDPSVQTATRREQKKISIALRLIRVRTSCYLIIIFSVLKLALYSLAHGCSHSRCIHARCTNTAFALTRVT